MGRMHFVIGALCHTVVNASLLEMMGETVPGYMEGKPLWNTRVHGAGNLSE